MSIRLSLTSAALDAEAIQMLTRDFYRTAGQETGLEVEPAYGSPAPGSRDAGALIGLLLTFASSGAAVALINVCKTFLERNSSIEIGLERGDKKLTIKAQNVNSEQIAKTLETIREYFGADG